MPGPLPLLGLRAFVESGRAGSITAAARTLGVTPGAVSQQVKALEARLRVTLFKRHIREIRLTPAGVRLLSDVDDAFRRIEDALGNVQGRPASGDRVLTVTTTGSFATTWLVPRLGRFTLEHPGVDVRVVTTTDLLPLGTGPGCADIAIRHGLGNWPGLEAQRLFHPRLVPVGSPGLLRSGPPIREPADCLQYPLLHDAAGADWRLWFRAFGLGGRDPRIARGTRFSESTPLIRAACAGQGLALVRDIYVEEDVAAGRLAIALEAPCPAQFAYYVATPPGARGHSRYLAEFRGWLMREAAAET